MALTKLTTDLIDGSLGTDWVETIQTSNFTAAAGKGYFVNTTSAEITVTLPAGTVGTEIVIQDYAGKFATNKVIFASNGSEKIQGSTDDYKCITNNATVNLVYQDATKGWTADNIETNVIPLIVDYLVVAGGGGGGGAEAGGGGGGGGAGGYQTSFNNASLSAFNATIGETYTITIGAGGSSNANGINSSILGTGVSITSIAGGAGGDDNDFGNDGGSGGGEGGGGSNGSLDGGVGTAGQGNNGGANGNVANGGSALYPYPGGGGGGAGAVGGVAVGSTGGNGGIGLENLITGTSTFFAGGGGGGRGQGQGVVGTGGAGGGGSGNNSGSSANGFPGTPNTGGGGGGASSGSSSAGGTGGSGVVILRYTNSYTVTIGSGLTGSTSTDGSDNVTTFTAGTGNISFS